MTQKSQTVFLHCTTLLEFHHFLGLAIDPNNQNQLYLAQHFINYSSYFCRDLDNFIQQYQTSPIEMLSEENDEKLLISEDGEKVLKDFKADTFQVLISFLQNSPEERGKMYKNCMMGLKKGDFSTFKLVFGYYVASNP